MPTDAGDRKAPRAQHAGGGSSPAPPPPQSENLPCPRCDSTNTKFCYYNNYNLSQPRHFCKSCRRYWTQGGTLRNVPVGGGTRKNSKRSRSTNSSSSSSTSSTSASTVTHEAVAANAIAVFPGMKADMISGDVNLNDNAGGSAAGNGSFTSLLSSQGQGFLALGGYGYGFEDMGFGFGRGSWAYPEVGNVGDCGYDGAAAAAGAGVVSGAGAGGGSSVSSSGCNTWQINGVEGGLVDGDCFAWPDLAISTPGNAMK